ncbi:hypothetical protein [Mycoplasma crocodyli]|uniref:hypothetical protein n=1 Tax=Mycoplasma crocodyli TaxID=50052 RepID=UPI00059F1B5A|nr:hypothetical protein [Mycoplasma crocodyli]
MKRFNFNTFVDYIRFGLRYKYTYVIISSFLLLFTILMVLSHFYSNLKFVDYLFSSLAVVFLLDLLCLMFKWGFLKTSIERFKEGRKNSKLRREEDKIKRMSNSEASAYRYAKEKEKQNEIIMKQYKSNLGWYFILFSFLIAIIITLPFLF